MKGLYTLICLFIGSFIIHYFLLPPIMSKNMYDVTNHLGKLYLSTISGLMIVVLEVLLRDHQYQRLSVNKYVFIGGLLALFIFLYRNQQWIDDNQYLADMIEKQSNGLLLSEAILKKSNSYNVSREAKIVVQTYSDQLRILRDLLETDKKISKRE